MLNFLYDFCLFLACCILFPKWLFQKKHRRHSFARLGIHLPQIFSSTPPSQARPCFWIHMVSMGETRAMIPIYNSLKSHYPDASFFFSSTTATGHQEAKSLFPGAKGYFFLPVDLSINIKRLLRRIRPTALILSESDFWYNLVRLSKEGGASVILLNGKMSEKSCRRFSQFPWFTKRLFSSFDLLCLQNQEYATRFSSLPIFQEKITITGNLKLSIPRKRLSLEERKKREKQWSLTEEHLVITLGSTHHLEEELILAQLPPWTHLRVLIVPRHPERFAQVKATLKKLNDPRYILVDQMGILPTCYELSSIAIVGGSFISGVGGHNVVEAAQCGALPLFGPYMHSQKELSSLLLEAGAGVQTSIEALKDSLTRALEELPKYKEALATFAYKGEEVQRVTWQVLKNYLETKQLIKTKELP